jgi:tryptophanyl-tRNA synthetase
MAADILLY